jgi:CRP/FNR family transcriptional regulator, transcriptional activator FtrB
MLIGQKDQQLLLNVQLLSDLPDNVLQQLIQDAFVQGLPKATTLFDQGGHAQFLHVVLSGRAAITSAIGDRETIVTIRESGEVILDAATVLGTPYSNGARLIEGGRIMMIPVAKFREVAFADAATGAVTLRAFANANLTLARHIRDLKLLTTIQRLARHLLSMTAATAGAATFTLRDERPVLAALLGMTPESLSRAFAHLRTIGVRADKSGAVSVENVRRLRSLSKIDERAEGEPRGR